MLVAAAGPISNLVQAVIAAALFRVLVATHLGAGPALQVLERAVVINLLLAFFNLIPVPPLDGGNVALGLLPPALAASYAKLRQFGFLVLYALMFTGVASALIFPPTDFFLRILLP